MYRPTVLIIASIGLIGSFLLNLATFAHYNLLDHSILSGLCIGFVVSQMATISAYRKLGFSPRQMQFAPDEVRYPVLVLVGYMLFAFVTIFFTSTKETTHLEFAHGHILMPGEYSARLITAVLMVGYGSVAATQNLAKLDRYRAPRRPKSS